MNDHTQPTPAATTPSSEPSTNPAPNPAPAEAGDNAPAPAENPTPEDDGQQALFDDALLKPDEQKPEGEEGEKPEGEEENKEGEEGEEPTFDIDALTTPEGQEIPSDIKTALSEFAKEHKLTNEAAQQIVDMGVKQNKMAIDNWIQTRKDWRTESERDPEIGNENFTKSVQSANSVVRQFASNPNADAATQEKQFKEFQDDLILLGLGQKKSFIRFCVNIGKHFENGGIPTTGDGESGGNRKPSSAVLYPDMPQ